MEQIPSCIPVYVAVVPTGRLTVANRPICTVKKVSRNRISFEEQARKGWQVLKVLVNDHQSRAVLERRALVECSEMFLLCLDESRRGRGYYLGWDKPGRKLINGRLHQRLQLHVGQDGRLEAIQPPPTVVRLPRPF